LPETPIPFLNRAAELKRLQRLFREGKSFLVHGPAGIGKSALLAEANRLDDHKDRTLLFTPGNLGRAPWLRETIVLLATRPGHMCRSMKWPKLRGNAGSEEIKAAVAKLSGPALQALLFDAFTKKPFTLILDPLEFMSRQLYELLRDVERITQTPLVFVARSPHMEAIGNATRFYWPRDQHVALGPLLSDDAEKLFDLRIALWEKLPKNMHEFRQHILDYADGNPGTLLRLMEMAPSNTYWSGGAIKIHLLTVDSNIPSFSSKGSS
jgi:energy-coupling factor transporter ATP-binding protein EcfA2